MDQSSLYQMPKHDITATLPVVMVAPEQIHANPRLFQFRHSASSPTGIRSTNRYNGKWNEAVHGDPLLLYEDTKGTLFVVDGHHRLEFARRLNSRFFSNAPKFLKAQILQQADGITPEQAKIIGAYRNIKKLGIREPVLGEKLVEAAEVMHEIMKQPEFGKNLPPLPPTDEILLSAKAATLDDASFRIAMENLPETLAVPVAAFTADQPMPDATRVQVLRIIANQLAPLHRYS